MLQFWDETLSGLIKILWKLHLELCDIIVFDDNFARLLLANSSLEICHISLWLEQIYFLFGQF